MYAPLPEGQARSLRRAYEVAGYGPETVELVEALGSGVMAHLRVDAPAARHPETTGAAPLESDEGSLNDALGSQPNLVAQFPPRVILKLQDTVPVAIDPGALHFFDEETGAALS